MSPDDREVLVDVAGDDNYHSANSERNFNMGSQEVVIDSTSNQPNQNPQQPMNEDQAHQPQTYKLSKQRWLVLFAITLYGLLCAATGEFSVILNTMLKLLELPLDKYIYIGQLFMYLPAISTIPTAWFIDRYGFKVVMYVAVVFMLIRSFFRALMFYPDYPNWQRFKLVYWIISGLAASQSAAIFFCTPLKISENWFAESERSIAWTIMISSYSIGGAIASFIFPRFIHNVSDVKPLAYLNFISGIVVAIVAVSCITRSKPKHPPSERTIKSAAKKLPWLSSIKKMFKQRDIVLHIMHEIIFDCMLLAVLTVIQDILTRSGHSEIFVGNIMSINSILSVIVVVILAAFVHRVTDITLACKLASITRALVFVVHLLTMLYPTEEWIILAVSVIFIICKSWALPNNNNMTANLVSGTVSEATIAGVSTTLFVIMASVGQVAFVKLIRKNELGESDYTRSMTMACMVCVVNSLIYIIFFKGQKAKDEGNSDSRGGGVISRQNFVSSSESHVNRAFDS